MDAAAGESVVAADPRSMNGEGRAPSVPPPYWQHQRCDSESSRRTSSRAPIALEDHTEEPSDRSGGLWARGVRIDDYVVVSGSRTGVGAYVVYNCTVETLDVGAALPCRPKSAQPRLTSTVGSANGHSQEVSHALGDGGFRIHRRPRARRCWWPRVVHVPARSWWRGNLRRFVPRWSERHLRRAKSMPPAIGIRNSMSCADGWSRPFPTRKPPCRSCPQKVEYVRGTSAPSMIGQNESLMSSDAGKTQPKFLEKRRMGLSYFLKSV